MLCRHNGNIFEASKTKEKIGILQPRGTWKKLHFTTKQKKQKNARPKVIYEGKHVCMIH